MPTMHMKYDADPRNALAQPGFAGLYALTTVVGLLMLVDLAFYLLGMPAWRSVGGYSIALVAAILGGARIVYGAVVALLEGDAGADLALAIALVASILLGEYWVAAEVVLIALVGESLEAFTFGRTHRELSRVLELRPRRVRVRRNDAELDLAADEVLVGDIVIVRPGERIAVDGHVALGRSAVDQSSLTGESVPIDKGVGDQVFAGTMNQFGALEVTAERVGSETTLGQVIRMIADARVRKARVERVADRMARLFLPMVLAAAAITFAATNRAALWGLMFGGPVALWNWMPTLAVLVVTCPCALILATPASVMAALAWTAKHGVLIKGGYALERLATVRCLAFDKTGTLTTGNLQLGDVVALSDRSADDVLALAAAAERPSEHLLAAAIVRAAGERNLALPQVENFAALPGAGVSAQLVDAPLLVGNARLMTEQGIEIDPATQATLERLESNGQTTLLVALNGRVQGALGLRDTVRPEALDVIRQLRQLGISEIAMLTGDRPTAATRVAREVGVDRVEAELRPADKANWLKLWHGQRATAQRQAVVGMIGDGVNDAPALASADVGLALGGIGSDLAAEAGDIVFLGAPLTPLPGLLLLARQTVRVIYQNIILFAFFANILGIVLTAWLLPALSPAWEQRAPIAAALFHQTGSVLVLLNAMRLLWFERWRTSWIGRIEESLAGSLCDMGTRLSGVRQIGRSAAIYWPRWLGAAAAAALLLYLATSFIVVAADEVAVVRRCGKLVAVLDPGLHVRLPWPWEVATRQKPRRVNTLQIGLRPEAVVTTSATAGVAPTTIEWNTPHGKGKQDREAVLLTGNQSLVELGVVIQYRIEDLPAWLFSVRDSETALRELAVATVCEVVASFPVVARQPEQQPRDILAAGRATLEAEIARRLQQQLDELELGVQILNHGVCLQDVHPPVEVVPAFREVSSAFKEKGRLLNEADAEYRRQVILAGGSEAWRQLSAVNAELTPALWQKLRVDLTGEAAAELLAAQAFSVSRENLASGDAAQYLMLQAAEAVAPQATQWRMLIDTASLALRGKAKLILDSSTSGRRHLLLGAPGSLTSPYPQLFAPPAPPIDPDE